MGKQIHRQSDLKSPEVVFLQGLDFTNSRLFLLTENYVPLWPWPMEATCPIKVDVRLTLIAHLSHEKGLFVPINPSSAAGCLSLTSTSFAKSCHYAQASMFRYCSRL